METHVPPFRFALVCCARECNKVDDSEGGSFEKSETIYRGAYPSLRNFPFLRNLGLATIISFVKGGKKGMTLDLFEFCENEGITLVIVDLGEEGKIPDASCIRAVLSMLMNKTRLPAYIHCADGGVSTGTCIMCLRLLQRWSMESMVNEYCRFVKDGSVSNDVRHFVSSFATNRIMFPSDEELVSWMSKP